MRKNHSHGERMKRFMTVLLAAFIMLVAAATIAYAEEDEDNGANETETDSEDSGEEGNESTRLRGRICCGRSSNCSSSSQNPIALNHLNL